MGWTSTSLTMQHHGRTEARLRHDCRQLGKILVLPCREPSDALPIHTRGALVGSDFHPSQHQRLGCKHLVHKTVPLAAVMPQACFATTTPLTRADSMRSVHTEALAQVVERGSRAWASAPVVALSAIPVLCCFDPDVTSPPSCPPSLGPVLLAGLFTIGLDPTTAVLCGL